MSTQITVDNTADRWYCYLGAALILRKGTVKTKRKDYQTQEYWDKLLTDYGLSMSRGTSHQQLYLSTEDLEIIEKKEVSKGRVLPKKTDS
jgi:hypothetical protein